MPKFNNLNNNSKDIIVDNVEKPFNFHIKKTDGTFVDMSFETEAKAKEFVSINKLEGCTIIQQMINKVK